MPARRMGSEPIDEMYAAVADVGSVQGAARRLKIPRPTAEYRYNAALSQGRPDVRHDARALRSMGYNPNKAPQCDLTEHATAPDATVVAFGDAHWTTLEQPRSLAHEALLVALPHIKPTHLISVGDLLDMGEPNRHPPVMWEARPRVRDEIEAGQQHLEELVAASGNAIRYWIRGNHDDRFDKWLAAQASAFEGVEGFALTDHFPAWRFCHVLRFNDAVFMHRYHGGIHAGYNNTMKAGLTVVSGDTHTLEVKPYNDMRGRRWGVQCGMLADPAWPCFRYTLGNSRNWNPGWVVLRWRDGLLLPPETCEVANGAAWFRGEPLAGRPRVRVRAVRA